MSIAGIGSQGPGNLSQVLSSLFSKLDKTSSSTDTTTIDSSTATTTTAAADGGLTGSTKPSLSSMILGVLMGMQQQSSTSDSSSTTDASSGSNPASKLFSAMDSDSDGSITQSEMESYIEGVGGSASDADNLYSQLNTSGSSSGISESDFESQAAPPPPPPGGPGQAHHGHDSKQASSAGDQMVSALDSDGDGSISETELSDYLTANGGSSTEASSLFSSLSSDGTSGVTASDFDSAISAMTSSFATNPYTTILNALDTFSTSTATASKTAGSTVSVSA